MTRRAVRRALAAFAAFALALAGVPSPADDTLAVAFTPDEIAKILAHGPWPPEVKRDPSNRVSGNARHFGS